MLNLNNIVVKMDKYTQLEKTILNGINLQVREGEFIVIVGGNGAGKSTLFNVISGFIKPEAGTVFIDEKDYTHDSQMTRASLISKVLQDPRMGTMENLSILENMAFAFKRGKTRGFQLFSRSARIALFKDTLSILNMGLENRLNEPVSHLSGGQRQVLSLMMAILQDSKILLLDEMTAALDPGTSEAIMKVTNKIVREQKRTCIMITHNMAHALQYGDRLLFLKNGTFVKEYDMTTRSKLTQIELVAQFEDIVLAGYLGNGVV